MKKILIIAKSVMLVMSMVGIAHANNTWTGFYVGAQGGFAFNDAQLKSQQLGFTSPNEACNTSADFSSFFPGIQGGYLYQFTNAMVAGVEANFTINDNQIKTLSCHSQFNPGVYDSFEFRDQLQVSIKGRVGRDFNWYNHVLLPYLTAGVSLANLGLTYQNEGNDYYSNSKTQTGWLVGAGVEWAFMKQWSVRAEYFYVDYGNAIKVNIPSVYGLEDPEGSGQVSLRASNVMVGISYWI